MFSYALNLLKIIQINLLQMEANQTYKSEKKLVAALLAIFAGAFGIHKFYLGYTKEGIIQIIITFITFGIGSIIGFIEGIMYLMKSDEDFDNTYVKGKKGWF